jgi:glycerol-3-phosphate cytidylyltransferase
MRIIGEEYRDQDFTGRHYCIEENVEIYYNKRTHRFSSEGLRKVVASKQF